MGRYTKLLMITAENNNKYYEMTEKSGIIDVKYGRVDLTSSSATYPLGQWDSIVASKVKKGYKDVTHLVSVKEDTSVKKKVTEITTLADIDDKVVANFLAVMKKYTDGLVSSTYTVKAVDVSRAQVDEAQKIINELNKIDPHDGKNEKAFNTKLLELYTVIPRYMSHVTHHLLPSFNAEKGLQQEQDNLDAMAAQVSMLEDESKIVKEEKKEKIKVKSLLDVLGITMKTVTSTKIKELQYLLDQIPSNHHRVKIQDVFEVNKPSEDKDFDEWVGKAKDKRTKILIHGTRCTSVIPILEQGLKIRPVGNYQFSGKAYGDGNYFSEVINKSVGYTGYDKDSILLVYEVHTGNPFVYDGWYRGNSFTLNLKELSSRGFDSTYVKAGNGMLNSEIIAYSEKQNRLKYIIHLKR